MNERATHDLLLERLDLATTLLREEGEEHWAAWISADAQLIRAGDAAGLRHLLSAYGGMGSINDRLGPEPLRGVLSDIYSEASALERALNSE